MTDRIAYTAREAADAIGISLNRVYELAKKSEIPAIRIGGAWRFPIARIHEWMAQQGVVAENSTINRGRRAS